MALHEILALKNSSQLAQMSKYDYMYNGQPDFVEYIMANTNYNDMMCWKTPTFGYCVALKGDDHTVIHSFLKNTLDDFVMWKGSSLNGGTYASLTNVCDAKHLVDITRTGVWVDTYAPSYYTTEVGATFETSVYGNRIDFKAFCDNRGGVWRFLIDGETTVDVSVWREASGNQTITIATNLDAFEIHTVVATFIGADPLHAPTGGTARGWVSSANANAYGIDRVIVGVVADDSPAEFLTYNSNREFAFYCTYSATSTMIPEHSGVGSATKISDPVYKLDGVDIVISTVSDFNPTKAEKFELVQNFYGVVASTNIAEFNTLITITKDGVISNTGEFEALVDFVIGQGASRGYTPMLPLQNGVLETALTSFGNARVNGKDGTVYTFYDSFVDTIGVCGIDSTNTDLIAAFSIDHITKNNRYAESINRKDLLWANQNATTYLKVYNDVFYNDNISTGYKYYWRSRFMVGKFDGAYSKTLALFE